MKGRFLSFATIWLLLLLFVPFMISATAASPDVGKIMEAGFMPGEIVLTSTPICHLVFQDIERSRNVIIEDYRINYNNSNVSIVKLDNDNIYMDVSRTDFLNYYMQDLPGIGHNPGKIEGIFISRIYGSYYFRSYV